ncbi:MAG TPA: Gfo/Idh/MocA family oxidoreductase [Tepidisphaeraceae bacterium]|nr:Gfo/Idh/MocA family oxidoreductase [Tepidisphaeraceae bacterium]
MSQDNQVGRRDFVKATAATAGMTIISASAARGADANTQLKVGLIGCGGRGKWIGNLFQENANAKIVAVYDYFRDRANEAGDQLKVDTDRRYVGLQGYKELLNSDVDAVAIESPPYFHPEHAVAALAAGKHVYLAKPIAVDVPGCLAIVEAAKKVKGKLSVLVDFQTRVNEFYMGAAQRIRDGLIGKPISGQVYYVAGRLGKQAEGDSPMARLRNWVFDKALSGDIIVEQNIHVLDVANWFLGGHPTKACGTGGRKGRVDVGDCWDHFLAHYWYPNDVLMDFCSAQYTERYEDLCCRIFGTKGTVDSHYGGNVNILAKTGGYRGGNTGNIYTEGAIANIKNFCRSIADGQYLDNAQESANSNLTAILGRMAAYEGRMVTWDEMIQANIKLDAKLDLPANGPDWRG